MGARLYTRSWPSDANPRNGSHVAEGWLRTRKVPTVVVLNPVGGLQRQRRDGAQRWSEGAEWTASDRASERQQLKRRTSRGVQDMWEPREIINLDIKATPGSGVSDMWASLTMANHGGARTGDHEYHPRRRVPLAQPWRQAYVPARTLKPSGELALRTEANGRLGRPRCSRRGVRLKREDSHGQVDEMPSEMSG
ncbi:hypothetical protein M011DRAFT_293899 [Sporormia fimetaria CBS 119925]|uniref:Uncharacterized protein n=1 Tax=Sporormia fimetaria CBS 119925 TaxID=1340428 RepID=A0A6A6UYR9_9PLEO|nr:hypothetical protein M011DRAFT_293899 [Sporormia fimetaria CBS 119925]